MLIFHSHTHLFWIEEWFLSWNSTCSDNFSCFIIEFLANVLYVVLCLSMSCGSLGVENLSDHIRKNLKRWLFNLKQAINQKFIWVHQLIHSKILNILMQGAGWNNIVQAPYPPHPVHGAYTHHQVEGQLNNLNILGIQCLPNTD